MESNTTYIKHDCINAIISVMRFIMDHSTLHYNGHDKTVSVRYNGPNGWKLSVDSSLVTSKEPALTGNTPLAALGSADDRGDAIQRPRS